MKKNKVLLTIIIILIVLILGVITGLAVLYLKTDTFKSNEVLFAKYLFQNDVVEIFDIDNLEKQKQFLKDNKYISNGNILIQIQEEGKEEKNINIKTNSKYNKERFYSEAVLKNGQEDVAKFSFINDNNVYGIKSEDIYQYYIGIRNENLKDVAKKIGMSEKEVEEIPNYIPFETNNNIDGISKEQINYLKETYYNVLRDSISKEKYSNIEKTTINIQGKNLEVKGYKLTLNSNDIEQIILNILNKAQNDNNTLNILESILNAQGQINITEEIQKMIKTIQDIQNNKESQTEIIVYQNNGKTVRIILKLNNENSVMLDVVKNEKSNQKLIITITDQMQYTIEKINQEDYTTFIQEFEFTSDKEESNYKISVTNNFSNIIDNKVNNSSQVQIIEGNNTNIKVNYDKTVQITNENVEIQELKNNNTVIINNYPKEQLDIFFNNIGKKAEEVLPNIVDKMNLKTDTMSEYYGYQRAIACAVKATLDASGIEPILQNAGTVALFLFESTIKVRILAAEIIQESYNPSYGKEKIEDYATGAIINLMVYVYSPTEYNGKTPEQIFIEEFPSGSIVTPGTINAKFDQTKRAVVTINGATVKPPKSTTTYNISYINGTLIVTEQ